VVTPAETHHRIVKDALQAGKHVLVEKPFALKEHDAKEMVGLGQDKILMGGYITCYDPCVEEIKRRLKEIGEVCSVHSERMGPFPNHSHTDIISDLTCHDVATLLYLEIKGNIENAYDVPKKRSLQVRGEKGELVTDYHGVWWDGTLSYERDPSEQPLLKEVLSFFNAIETGEEPRTGRAFGLAVVKECERIRAMADLELTRYVSYRPNGFDVVALPSE